MTFTYDVEDFKTYFSVRYFSYLTDIVYSLEKIYNTGDEVYYNNSFFTSAVDNNVGNTPVDGEYWVSTIDSVENYVMDSDIANAIGEAMMNFNEGLWGTENEKKLAFGYLVAHYLCCDIQTALQGIASSGNYPIQSKTVGSISVGFAIPLMYLNDPFIGYLNKTGFGQKYFSLLLPRLRGKGFAIAVGRSLP